MLHTREDTDAYSGKDIVVTIALYTHAECELHHVGAEHPERSTRLAAIRDALAGSGMDEELFHCEAPPVEREALLRIHPAWYIDDLFSKSPADGTLALDPHTVMNPYTIDAARRAAGAGVSAVDQVLAGEFTASFCAVRPPGHHAKRATAGGFCFFNNVAVAALHALDRHGLERVAVCDFDVHHGDGSEDIFDGDPRVLFCSTFQHPLAQRDYRPEIPGQRVACPLSEGTDGEGFRHAIKDRWLPALDAFAPQLVLVSAGFDAHARDPLGGLDLQDCDFHWIAGRLREVAGAHAGGRIVSMLEGGYDAGALGPSVVAYMRGLLREPLPSQVG